MKRILVIAVILFASTFVFAQSIEFTPLFGYTFSGEVGGRYGASDVKNGMMYGALLDVEIDHLLHAELSYRRVDPQMEEYLYVGGIVGTYNIGIEHYQFGVIREFMEGQIKPFAGLALGTTRYFGKGSFNEKYWRFSGAVELGAKIFLTDLIGIRLQTNMTLPFQFSGGGIFCGTGGCGGGASFTVPIVHLDMTAGLIIKLAK
jgi:hypothetical protein